MNNNLSFVLLATAALSLAIGGATYAKDLPINEASTKNEAAPNYKEENLTGDWKGNRQKLSDAGLDISLVYTYDVLSNVAGGSKRAAQSLDNADLIFSIDGEKLYNVKGSKISLYFLNNDGGKPNANDVGSVQGVDNIEVNANTAKLFEAWIEQNFADDKYSVRAGLYNLNSEFYVTEASALFLNPTYGTGTELAQSGRNGPSVFPNASLALRGKWQPTKEFYIQAAALDGVPGDPGNRQGTHVQFNNGDGALYVAQTGYEFSFAKIAVGVWHYSSKSDDLIDVGSEGSAVTHRNEGAYAMIEKEFSEKISGFGRFGIANRDVNRSDFAWSAGVNVKKVIPGRDDGIFGLAASGIHNSSKYKRSQIAADSAVDAAETQFELTYSDKVMPWLTVQPDLQYTMNPGTNPQFDDSWLFGFRTKVSF